MNTYSSQLTLEVSGILPVIKIYIYLPQIEGIIFRKVNKRARLRDCIHKVERL